MKINAKVETLRSTLAANRKQHEQDFKEARTKYLARAKEEAQVMLAAIERGDFPARSFKALEPMEYLAHYDRALRMLEHHTEPLIAIEEDEYTRLVDDDWEWRHSFARNTLSYK